MQMRWALGLLAIQLAASSFAVGGDTALGTAIKNRDTKHTAALLKAADKAKVNEADAEGMMPLHWAAHWDDADLVKKLIAAGATVNARNRFGGTPIHEAATFGDVTVMEALVKAGADVNATQGEGDTPLMIATRAGIEDGVKLLLDHGALVDARDGWLGETPLMLSVAEGYPEIAKILIAHGADVNASSTSFPFRRRAQRDATYTIDPAFGGLTPLHFAARQNGLEIAEMLLKAGADPNKVEPESGFTPLMTAIFNQNFKLATLLVEKGADVKGGYLAAAAVMRNRPAVVDKNDGHFRLTPPEDSMDLIKAIIAHGADPNAPFTQRVPYNRVKVAKDATPFYIAAEYIDIPAMKELLATGGKPIPLKNGVTPLMAVMAFDDEDRPTTDAKYIEALQLCLDAGVDVNAKDNAEERAVHFAAGQAHDASLEFLVKHGADLTAKTKMGRTALDWAEGKRPSGYYANREQEGLPHRPTTIALIQKLTGNTTPAAPEVSSVKGLEVSHGEETAPR